MDEGDPNVSIDDFEAPDDEEDGLTGFGRLRFRWSTMSDILLRRPALVFCSGVGERFAGSSEKPSYPPEPILRAWATTDFSTEKEGVGTSGSVSWLTGWICMVCF